MSVYTATAARWSEPWRVHWEERAAIMEFDGGMTRENAELHAFAEVSKQREAAADRVRQ